MHSSGYCQAPTWLLSYAHDAAPSTLAIKAMQIGRKRGSVERKEKRKGERKREGREGKFFFLVHERGCHLGSRVRSEKRKESDPREKKGKKRKERKERKETKFVFSFFFSYFWSFHFGN